VRGKFPDPRISDACGFAAFARLLTLSSRCNKETPMSWKTPSVIEVAVGMEINCYACADI